MTAKTILIVDDEFAILDLLNAVLSDEGYRVITAENGQQALDLMAKEKPDLVISDMVMPRMDGAELVTAMAATPTLADVPMVIMSSLPEAEIASRCTGYRAFVRKPFRIAEVTRLVAETLG